MMGGGSFWMHKKRGMWPMAYIPLAMPVAGMCRVAWVQEFTCREVDESSSLNCLLQCLAWVEIIPSRVMSQTQRWAAKPLVASLVRTLAEYSPGLSSGLIEHLDPQRSVELLGTWKFSFQISLKIWLWYLLGRLFHLSVVCKIRLIMSSQVGFSED